MTSPLQGTGVSTLDLPAGRCGRTAQSEGPGCPRGRWELHLCCRVWRAGGHV